MKKSVNLWIIFCSIFIFLIKWYYPFENFDENIDVRVIFESVGDGYYNYPLLKALSNFNLNYSFTIVELSPRDIDKAEQSWVSRLLTMRPFGLNKEKPGGVTDSVRSMCRRSLGLIAQR